MLGHWPLLGMTVIGTLVGDGVTGAVVAGDGETVATDVGEGVTWAAVVGAGVVGKGPSPKQS